MKKITFLFAFLYISCAAQQTPAKPPGLVVTKAMVVSARAEASKIGVDSKAIVLTGSASVGFSLNPDNNLRAFTDTSDIDVAIISQHYFDISWHFLRNVGTKRYGYNRKQKDAIDDHRNRLIYWGTIATDRILQILPFGEK